ncbi:MAG: dipeptidase, partial [Terriglobia bacterium]
MTRRELLKVVTRAWGAALCAPMINLGRYPLFALPESSGPTEYSARAIELVGRALVIDMLSPFTLSPARRRKLLSDP